MLLGEKHLNYVVQEYAEYYNRCRPHSSRGNLPPARAAPLPPVHPPEHTPEQPPEQTEPVLCKHRLGGLLKHYFRKAA